MQQRREKTNYFIQSVGHALDVIEQFSSDVEELGVTDLSKRLKLHKNNVFRLLATLESRGYIEQNKATDNYRLGIRCLLLGQAYLRQVGILRQAGPIVESLSRGCRETVFVGMLRRGAVVPVHEIEGDQAIRIVPLIGQPLPLHCTAAGKVHLAWESEETVKSLLPETLERRTDRTITRRGDLLGDLKSIGQRGYAVDLGEWLPDLRQVAAPVRDYTRAVVGSVTLAGPAYRMTQEKIDRELAPLVLKAGQELSSRLGYNA